MEYFTYWTINDTPSNATQPYSIFLWILIFSLIIFSLIWKFKKNDSDKNFYLFGSGLFILLSLPAYIYLKFFNGNPNQERIEKYLTDKKIEVVEGQIQEFYRFNPVIVRNGKQPHEEFKVDSVKFHYLENALYEFSNFGGNHSDVFHNGLNVRITYVKGEKGNEIQKIEIKK
ncbi:hypothetical protein OA84_10395 [Kaistella solincola]|uniref:Uncharacterized protein n=1 Tax=Kaistella solincola TaxID=510955 RepID=A0ABR4ZQI5_9FLAO|nr:hypothetical protein [Kaistella solincola]KIA82564.1 hypothetical protein OA84_10395 [Kaistella solincola]